MCFKKCVPQWLDVGPCKTRSAKLANSAGWSSTPSSLIYLTDPPIIKREMLKAPTKTVSLSLPLLLLLFAAWIRELLERTHL